MKHQEKFLASRIVIRIKGGCVEAETELVRKFQRGLTCLVLHFTNDLELADDIAQETLIVVIRRLRSKSIEEPDKLAPFVNKTAKNILIGHLRKTERHQTHANTMLVERTTSSVEGQYVIAVRDQEATIVRKLLSELGRDRDRQILSRFYLLEHDKKIICEDLQLSDVHFNRVLYRARQRFGELIREFEQQERPHILENY